MKLEIDLTDDQVRFLKEFAVKHAPGAKDNLSTSMPIHTVQTRRERVTDCEIEDADKTTYVETDNPEYTHESLEEVVKSYYEYDECPIEIVSFNKAYYTSDFKDINGEDICIVNENDYFEAYGIPDDYCYKVSTMYYYEPVAFFFILDEAKRYIEYQGHNLCHPKTYTYGPGYSNKGDYEHFYCLLLRIGMHLNKELDGSTTSKGVDC